MWITPISFRIAGTTIALDGVPGPLPLPPWSGVPVAIQLEMGPEALAGLSPADDEGTLLARDEDGALVRCTAFIDPHGIHTCETDSMLTLVQSGPFEPHQAARP